jgi:hypothetical protein
VLAADLVVASVAEKVEEMVAVWAVCKTTSK